MLGNAVEVLYFCAPRLCDFPLERIDATATNSRRRRAAGPGLLEKSPACGCAIGAAARDDAPSSKSTGRDSCARSFTYQSARRRPT